MHREIFFLANVSKPEPTVESIFTGMVVVAFEHFVVCNVNTKHCSFFLYWCIVEICVQNNLGSYHQYIFTYLHETIHDGYASNVTQQALLDFLEINK